MPQMMPLSWLLLFSMFSLLLLAFNITNYFSSFSKYNQMMTDSTSFKSINWKW
uniref:ATP synthase F0 subunit 8 n=1 Tax=Callibia diana TaxID=1777913 RepID=UPI002551FBC0|nr:ATP synthase F0 subunit 8 [Callibia diana]WFD61146.1 ATP synthase F0 subunit 8 [Callibia diana]